MTKGGSCPCFATKDTGKKNPYMSRGYADYRWEDETSQFDPKGIWMYGSECYIRTYRCRVPSIMLAIAEKSGNFDRLHDWISDHNEVQEIWL